MYAFFFIDNISTPISWNVSYVTLRCILPVRQILVRPKNDPIFEHLGLRRLPDNIHKNTKNVSICQSV
jgi:hypothetical protein